jgi:hypothetical protein
VSTMPHCLEPCGSSLTCYQGAAGCFWRCLVARWATATQQKQQRQWQCLLCYVAMHRKLAAVHAGILYCWQLMHM